MRVVTRGVAEVAGFDDGVPRDPINHFPVAATSQLPAQELVPLKQLELALS